jgi:hypothetical protein
VREAFTKRGHDAWSCDLLPTEISSKRHIQEDVLKVLDYGWDLMIAHPPCTYLCKSGVQWLHQAGERDEDRWEEMKRARDFFLKLLNAPISKICIENPVPHRYAVLPKYTQIVQPYHFGDAVQKQTCLWLKGLPPLMHTCLVGHGEKYIGKNGKSNGSAWYQLHNQSSKNRSRTFLGIAAAMAEQWGNL